MVDKIAIWWAAFSREAARGSRVRWVALVCAVLVTLAPPWAQAARARRDTPTRPKIGLALSGGGARGAAHIGVLRVLEEHRVPVDYVAGVSMGAIVGGLYASGMPVEELEALVSRIDWTDAFVDRIPRRDRSFRRKRDDDLFLVKHKPGLSGGKIKLPAGVLDGQKIDLLLKRYTLPVVTVRDFDKLPIPYRAVATNLVTGDIVVIDRGDLALAMRSSMSIPVVFAPREVDHELLVDGGVRTNLPVDIVREMGADVVVAVDIGSPLLGRDQLESILTVTSQITTIMSRPDSDRQIASLTGEDVLIQPDLGDIAVGSFDRTAEAVPPGAAAAQAARGQLKRLAVSPREFRAHIAQRRGLASRDPLEIDEIRVVNHSRLADGVVARRIGLEAGDTLDVDRLERDLGQIYGLELFESVYYDVTEESNRTVLTDTTREASWGPDYLQFGVAVFEDHERPNFNLAAAYSRTAINRLNGEWRAGIQVGQEPSAFTEFYQPVDYKLRKFVHLRAFAREEARNVFDADGNEILELGLRRYGVEVALGRELGTWGEVRAGAVRETGTTKVQVGDPSLPESDFDRGEAFVQFYVDELDDVKFPRRGSDFRVRARAGLEELGSDLNYEQGTVEGAFAMTSGRYSGLFDAEFGTTRDSDAPVQSLFSLGGFTRLSGLERNEISGQHAALLSGAFYRRMGGGQLIPVYAGLSVEYGNAFQRRADVTFDSGIVAGSVFVGVDTIVGPIYVAYGFAEGGRRNYYLILGQSLGRRPHW